MARNIYGVEDDPIHPLTGQRLSVTKEEGRKLDEELSKYVPQRYMFDPDLFNPSYVEQLMKEQPGKLIVAPRGLGKNTLRDRVAAALPQEFLNRERHLIKQLHHATLYGAGPKTLFEMEQGLRFQMPEDMFMMSNLNMPERPTATEIMAQQRAGRFNILGTKTGRISAAGRPDEMCMKATDDHRSESGRYSHDFCFSTALAEMREGKKLSRRNWAEDEYIQIGDIDHGDGNVYSGLVHNLRAEQFDPTQADIMAQNWYVHPGYIVEQPAARVVTDQQEIRREV